MVIAFGNSPGLGIAAELARVKAELAALKEKQMETANMEQMIEELEKTGWRVSNLSYIKGNAKYSCILERKKTGDDGFLVYASSELLPTPSEALSSAWANAQRPASNPRVHSRHSANAAPGEASSPLAEWLAGHEEHRVALGMALHRLQKAYEPPEEEDDEW